jgi:hypothetical protein
MHDVMTSAAGGAGALAVVVRAVDVDALLALQQRGHRRVAWHMRRRRHSTLPPLGIYTVYVLRSSPSLSAK